MTEPQEFVRITLDDGTEEHVIGGTGISSGKKGKWIFVYGRETSHMGFSTREIIALYPAHRVSRARTGDTVILRKGESESE